MATGLDVADIVRVTVNLAPIAAPTRNFGALLIVGSSSVIDVNERKRQYANIAGVAGDFPTTAPEYLAASLFFSQSPQPSILYIGRWAQSPTAAVLHGGVLTPSQQLLSNFTAITAGGLVISIDGVAKTVSGLNLSGATNLNGVASLVQAALVTAGATGATVTWNANIGRFDITSGTTGTGSTIGYATGTIAIAMGMASGAASSPVGGIAAETLLSAVSTLEGYFSDWYGLTIATATPPSDSDYLSVAGLIEAASPARIFGVTVTNTNVLDSTTSADLASSLKTLNVKRTFDQYSSSSPYAVASFFGRAFTVNFRASNSTLTMKFKTEPGVAAETLTETQAATLKAKRCNVFVNYSNGTAIIQDGVMAAPYWFDEVHGLDWLANDVQTALYNALYTSPTKIPQTDAGNNVLKAVSESRLSQAVTNGLVAPGQWNGPPITAPDGKIVLNTGDVLSSGFLVYVAPVATQSQADREARHAVPQQIAVKLAGAIHDVDALITVNR